MKKILLLVMVLLSISPYLAIAQGVNSQEAKPQGVDEEEQLDDAVQQFGYVSGAAFQCAASNQAQTLEKDARKAFTGIVQLFGSDRAFFYAAAYGAGATGNIDRNKCAQYTRQFQESMQKNTLKRGE
jgi:hypothetical protein